MYAQALTLYEGKKFDESLKQFQAIEDMLPNYKSTRPYLKRVNQQVKRNEQQRYKLEQIQQAVTIKGLAKQANTLFMKIQLLSDDNATSSAKKKFAMVDKIFANMSREQAKLFPSGDQVGIIPPQTACGCLATRSIIRNGRNWWTCRLM